MEWLAAIPGVSATRHAAAKGGGHGNVGACDNKSTARCRALDPLRGLRLHGGHSRTPAWAGPAHTREFLLGTFASLLVATLYLACSLVFTEFRDVFEFNPDEGNNLIKALLLAQGKTFTHGIWSDQPPLFAYALLGCFKLFGMGVDVARTVVLVTSAVLVFSLYDGVRMLSERRAGLVAAHLGATMAVGALLLAGRFAPLRVSVMIGIPSIAFVSLAVWAALRAGFVEHGARARAVWGAVAGACLAVSLGIKLFTLFVAPVVCLTVLGPRVREFAASRVRARPVAVADQPLLLRDSAAFAIGFVPVLLLVFSPVFAPQAFAELFRSHLAAERGYQVASTVGGLLVLDWGIYLGALTGVVLLARDRRWEALPWCAWLALAMAALALHNPVWLHHSLLMVVPAAGLLGLGMTAVIDFVPAARRAVAALAVVSLASVLLLTAADARLRRLAHPGPRHESRGDKSALAAIERANVAPGSMITARQIFAFYLQRPIPERLSVTSLKRLQTGGLEAGELEQLVAAGEARLVLLSDRWPADLREAVRRNMGTRYERFYEDPANGELELWRRVNVR